MTWLAEFACQRIAHVAQPKVRPPNIAQVIELWPEAERELFEERAAVREFDGGMDRQTAERLALEDIKNLRRYKDPIPCNTCCRNRSGSSIE